MKLLELSLCYLSCCWYCFFGFLIGDAMPMIWGCNAKAWGCDIQDMGVQCPSPKDARPNNQGCNAHHLRTQHPSTRDAVPHHQRKDAMPINEGRSAHHQRMQCSSTQAAMPTMQECKAQHPRVQCLQACSGCYSPVQQPGRLWLCMPVVSLRGALRKAIRCEDLHISHRV